MSTLFIFLLVILPFNTESLVFPRQDEGPLIAVLDFVGKRMDIFDPSDGGNATVIEAINLMDERGGGSTAIDFNYRGNVIYWTDLFTRKVYSLKAKGGYLDQKIIFDGVMGSPEGLAYDWIHNNLYVCDWRRHTILVINPETGAWKTLLTDVHRVRDIEVDPRTGWLYWIAGRQETAVLTKSTLDGQNQVVITSDLERPMSLSLDYDEQRLYWIEVPPLNIIKSIRVDGENMTTIHQALAGRLMHLTDYIYWNQGMATIRRADKQQATDITRYRNLEEYSDRGHTRKLFSGILAIDPRKQQQSPSLCGDNNGGCSHFCLPTLIQSTPPYNCACPDGMTLMDDNKTCSDEKQI